MSNQIIDMRTLLSAKTSSLPACVVLRKHQVNLSTKATKLLNLEEGDAVVFQWHIGRRRLFIAPVKKGRHGFDTAIPVIFNSSSNDVKINSSQLANLLQEYEGYSLTVNGKARTSVRFLLASTPISIDGAGYSWYMFE